MNKFEASIGFNLVTIIQNNYFKIINKHQVRKFCLHRCFNAKLLNYDLCNISHPASFFKQIFRDNFPKSFLFSFLLEIHVTPEGCSLSVTGGFSIELGDSASILSLLLLDCESVDC